MKQHLLLLLLLFLSACTTFLQSKRSSYGVPDYVTQENADSDEWKAVKAEIAKDPFVESNQFSINFAVYGPNDWHYPLPGGRVISPFGGARHHGGTDIKVRPRPGDTIRAAFPGEVILSEPYYAYGNLVILRHANGLETRYSHNVKNLVKKGQWVQAGQPIALTGRTGRATTEHLHFETRVSGKAFDSAKLFDHNANELRKKKFIFTKQKNGAVTITTED